MLVEGHSVESAASNLSISRETVRVHLKSVFRKINVTRQQDLLRVLLFKENFGSLQPAEGDSSSDN